MSDLDSFFAKKDKKKGKTGKKFATTEEVAKKLEDITIKNKDKSKKDKVQSNNPDDSDNINENEDEWKEFQEDKKDYTGLKLQPLKASDMNTLDSDKDNELNEDGTQGLENGKKKPMGPWNQQNETKPVEEPVPAPQPSNSTGTYVCPRVKTQALEPLHGGRLRETLDVTSTTAFPTLDAAKPGGPKVVESVWNKKRVAPEVRSSDLNHDHGVKLVTLPVHESTPGSYQPPHMRKK